MEFENLQIEVPTGENATSYLGVKVFEKKYHNKSKGFVIGFDPNSKEYIERKQRRAKRFGCKQIEVITAEKENDRMSEIDRYKSINIKTLKWPPVPPEAMDEIRPDAILLYGVEHMSTNDVFEYFKLFGPETIEWIDDHSCNVVWDDKATVINAIDTVSKTFGKLLELQRKAAVADNPPLRGVTKPAVPVIIKEEEEDEQITCYENQVVVEDEEEIDPKDIWRVGVPFRENQLFLRYATVRDRKLPGAAQRSEYYLKYGKNPENTKNGSVAGVLSNSRKRKLQQMQKLAEERFKTKEPDVKIVALAELKAEGLISKMEVDEYDEPVVKRLNINNRDRISMTMVADKVEVQQRLGDRYAADTVHDRLGTPLPEDNKDERTGRIHDRLGVITLDGIGRRNNNVQDARDEIHHTRRTHNNQTYISGDGYIDDFGDYHDIYRASDLKSEDGDDKDGIDKRDLEVELYNHRNMYQSDDESNNRSQSSVRNRLGTSSREGGGGSAPVSDLRDKLRRREKSKQQTVVPEPVVEENVKDEDGEKVNLCIEIKQEPHEPPPVVTPMVEDEEEEFEF